MRVSLDSGILRDECKGALAAGVNAMLSPSTSIKICQLRVSLPLDGMLFLISLLCKFFCHERLASPALALTENPAASGFADAGIVIGRQVQDI